MKNLSLYVHIPFCRSKCSYCDFLSFVYDARCAKSYVSALVNEISAAAVDFAGHQVQTVYFGGGTPTTLPADDLIKILDKIRELYNMADDAEITVEANPDTVTREMLCILRRAGFNRLSIGVQSLNNTLLARINRPHTAEIALHAYASACEAGFDNISADLMFSIPGQNLKDFEESVAEVLALRPKPAHISCYGMTVEPGTPLGKEGYVPDEITDRSMYHAARKSITGAGYEHYEISNFALAGKRSRHNMVYWTGGEYLGFGLSAHSFIGGVRFRNEETLERYKKTETPGARCEVLELSKSESMAEFMFLGLRLVSGINCRDFLSKFDKNIDTVYGQQIRELAGLGLVEETEGGFRLTFRGIDLSNQVFGRFLTD